jgi:hypothetical protein
MSKLKHSSTSEARAAFSKGERSAPRRHFFSPPPSRPRTSVAASGRLEVITHFYTRHTTRKAHLAEAGHGVASTPSPSLKMPPRAPPAVCAWPDCGREYATKRDLQRHQLSHGAPQFACNTPGCDRKFYRRDALLRHQRNKTWCVLVSP